MLSVCIRVHPWPKTNLRKLTERQRKQAIWPRMDTDTHGCGVSASSRSTGRRLEQNCMVMFWRNAILVFILLWNLALNTINRQLHMCRDLFIQIAPPLKALDPDIGLLHPPRSADGASESLPSLFELRSVMLYPPQKGRVSHAAAPL